MAFNFLSKITGRAMEGSRSEDLAVSIQEHLVHLLNIRQGRTQHLEDYGLPDIHEIYYNLPGSLKNLAERIEKTIKKYEPRLSGVRVRQENRAGYDDDEFSVTYRITGEVVEGTRVSRLTFRTEVARDGHATMDLVKQYG
ncbi:MAG: type VI secretion system baseplate subunit TssE [Acidobacteriota bacterium]|nr:type VI secretion system baseplate subunit TssE [Acidobacteriota bacterium]